jgi:hypothetical protein
MKIQELLLESTQLSSTLINIVNSGEAIAQHYELLKNMAKNWIENRGDFQGFQMMAAGQGSRWYNNFYFNKMQKELYDLTKQASKTAPPLLQFLHSKGKGRAGHKTFGEIAYALPPILKGVAQKIGSKELYTFADNWINRHSAYKAYLSQLQSEANADSSYDEPEVKAPKDKTAGQTNKTAQDIVNMMLAHAPEKVAGDIRAKYKGQFLTPAIVRDELKARGIDVLETMAGVGMEPHAREQSRLYRNEV